MAKSPKFVAAAMGTAAELELVAAVKIWQDAQHKLSIAVEAERAARAAIVEKYFPKFEEGTHTGSLREHNLKCEMKVNRTVVQEQYAAAHQFALDHPGQGEALAGLLSRAFRAKQELNTKDWKGMTPAERMILADIVVEKPGTPSLKLEPKK